MHAGLSDQTLQPHAQRLINQRAQSAAAFGLSGLHHSFAQRGGRGTQAVWYGLEGFQPFGGQDGVLKTERVAFSRDVSGINQPVQTSVTELSLIGQKIVFWTADQVFADEFAYLDGNRQRELFVEVGKGTSCNFIKPFNIGDRHDKVHL